jgi:hypothetical protein
MWKASPLRPAVTAYAGLPLDLPAPTRHMSARAQADATCAENPAPAEARLPGRVPVGRFVARIYAVLPLNCPQCGSPRQLIAAVTEREPLQRILRRMSLTSTRSVSPLA